MAKTLIFKKEHEKKLKQLKIKSKFSKELRRSFSEEGGRNGMVIKTMDQFMSMQKKLGWYMFISTAFDWRKTIDGYAYWKEIFLKKD